MIALVEVLEEASSGQLNVVLAVSHEEIHEFVRRFDNYNYKD